MADLMAELESPQALLAAVRALRSSGHTRMTTYTPYPVPEVEEALELKASWIPRAVLVAGLTGVALGFGLQWWLNGFNYPLLVGGFPARSAFVFVPVTFESMILLSVLTAFFGVLIASRLPRLWHPVFEVEGIESATRDGFWIAVEAKATTAAELTALGARIVREASDGVT